MKKNLFALYMRTLYKLWQAEKRLFLLQLENKRLCTKMACYKRLAEYYPGMKELENAYELYRS